MGTRRAPVHSPAAWNELIHVKDVILSAFTYVMKVPQTCIPCWSYNIPLAGRSLFYSTRFFDLSRLPLCVQKDIVADLCQLPQTQCQGFPHARLRRSALGEAELGCGWRQQVLLPCV